MIKPKRWTKNWIERVCLRPECGTTFFVPLNQILIGKGKYCSLSCSGRAGGEAVHQKHDQSGERNPSFKGELALSNYQHRLRYQERHPEKERARRILKQAIRSNQIQRKPCETCGTIQNIEGHHDDYTKPLDIRWLCRKHHLAVHRQS